MKVTGSRSAALQCAVQPPDCIFLCHAIDRDFFMSTLPSANKREARRADIEAAGKEREKRGVGLSIDWRAPRRTHTSRSVTEMRAVAGPRVVTRMVSRAARSASCRSNEQLYKEPRSNLQHHNRDDWRQIKAAK